MRVKSHQVDLKKESQRQEVEGGRLEREQRELLKEHLLNKHILKEHSAAVDGKSQRTRMGTRAANYMQSIKFVMYLKYKRCYLVASCCKGQVELCIN